MSIYALITARPEAWGLVAMSLLLLGHLRGPDRAAVVPNLVAAGLGLVGLLGELAAGGWLTRMAR